MDTPGLPVVRDPPRRMTRRDRLARTAASAAFAVQGLCFAGVLAQVPALRDRFSFSESELVLVLLAVPVIAGVGSVLAGVLAPRLGSAAVLRVAGVGVCIAVAAVGLAPTRPSLFLAVGTFGLVVGAVDATMNMQGVAVQGRYGRSILASCHGWWSLAAIAGTLATAAMNGLDWSLPASLGVVAGAGATLALLAGPWLLTRAELGPAGQGDAGLGVTSVQPNVALVDGEPGGAQRVPWGSVVLVGLAVMLMFIADSSVANWSGLFLRDVLAASTSVVPLGLAAYLSSQLLGRTFADRVISRFGPVTTIAVGALVATAGFGLVVAARTPLVAITGFALVGVGLCVVVPLSFSAAGALDPAGSGVAIARVNLFNYTGFVVGSALVGLVTVAATLRLAWAAPAVLVLGILVLAPVFRVAGRASGARTLSARSTAAR